MRTKQSHGVLLLVILACFMSQTRPETLRQKQTWPTRTYPGNIAFPDEETWAYFARQLDGFIITPRNCTLYEISIQVPNLRTIRRPAVIVRAKSIQDIQRCVLFARKYNLHLTIRSSGSDYIGRNSHDGSLNLDLRDLKDITIDLNSKRTKAGEATVQTGATWADVYTKVNTAIGPGVDGKLIGRMIVGSYYIYICMGGFTQSGGAGPISRKYGLAVDSLVEAVIVTADGLIQTINETSTVTHHFDGSYSVNNDTSLFWAIRGGGGCTWGVVYSFTFKLHYAPQRIRRVIAVIPTHDILLGKRINENGVKFALQQLNKLSVDWGGYIAATYNGINNIVSYGALVMLLNHIGSNSSESNKEINALLNHPSVLVKAETYHLTYWDFAMSNFDVPFTDSYLVGSFLDPETVANDTKMAAYVGLLYEMVEKKYFFAFSMFGGNMVNAVAESTPISPAFRRAAFSVEFFQGFLLQLDRYDPTKLESTLVYAQRMYSFGTGSYVAEPAEDMPDWKLRFWFSIETYNRLLEIKKKWDPTNFFWCHNGVGSDRGVNFRDPNLASFPGQPADSYFNSSVQFDDIKSGEEGNIISSLLEHF